MHKHKSPRTGSARRPSVDAARPRDGHEPRSLDSSGHEVVSRWGRRGLHAGRYFRREPGAWHVPRPGDLPLPEPEDVRQRDLGDCWFLAVLASYAAVNPRGLRDRITALPDGRFRVRLWESVDVGPDLYGPDPTWRGHADWGLASGTWAALFEKAAAKLRAPEGPARYASLGAGHPDIALQMLGFLGVCAGVERGKVADGYFTQAKDGPAARFDDTRIWQHYLPPTVHDAWDQGFHGREVAGLAGELAWDGRIVVLTFADAGMPDHTVAVLPGAQKGTADLYDQATGRRRRLTPASLPGGTVELVFSIFPAC